MAADGAWDDEDYSDLDELFGQQQGNAAGSRGGQSGNSHSVNNYYLSQGGMAGPGEFSQDDIAIAEDGRPYIKGLVFKIQIGAYKQRDLSDVMEGDNPQEAFEQEQSEGVNMYTLRHFKDYWKANKFKKELRAMGLKDAWIVAYKDGKRVPLKAVLKEVLNKK